MEVTYGIVNRVAVLTLVGNFNYRVQYEFRNASSTLLKLDWDKLEVDFAGVSNIDSAALGMLLMLRESASSAGRSISLTNCKDAVKSALDISNFRKIFDIN